MEGGRKRKRDRCPLSPRWKGRETVLGVVRLGHPCVQSPWHLSFLPVPPAEGTQGEESPRGQAQGREAAAFPLPLGLCFSTLQLALIQNERVKTHRGRWHPSLPPCDQPWQQSPWSQARPFGTASPPLLVQFPGPASLHERWASPEGRVRSGCHRLPGGPRGAGFCDAHAAALTDSLDSPVSAATDDTGVIFLLLISSQIHGVVMGERLSH